MPPPHSARRSVTRSHAQSRVVACRQVLLRVVVARCRALPGVCRLASSRVVARRASRVVDEIVVV